jgi:CubicO group peptidase (beta-lactamase class C family)
MMDSFPPAPERQVTLANWRAAPFSRWGFHHVREIVPSADIANDRKTVRELPRQPTALPLGNLEDTDTDGIAVLHKGRILYEHYAHGMTGDDPHILMSVSKSMLGLLAGILVSRNILELERPVVEVVPELKSTAYNGATIRQLLDMRAGIAFDEDYLATSGPIVEYRKATAWNPLGPGETPSDLRSYFSQLKKADGKHGGRFHYVSPNTDLLGWVIERCAATRYADLMSELIWKPMGAERSAYITVDRLGAPRCAGGMCATTRDLARVGQMIAEGGKGVVPAQWIEDLCENGDPKAWEAGPFVEYFGRLPMHYRGKWYVVRGPQPLLLAFGIHGQHLFIDRDAELVIAKFSSQAMPLDAARMAATLAMVGEVRNALRGA